MFWEGVFRDGKPRELVQGCGKETLIKVSIILMVKVLQQNFEKRIVFVFYLAYKRVGYKIFSVSFSLTLEFFFYTSQTYIHVIETKT